MAPAGVIMPSQGLPRRTRLLHKKEFDLVFQSPSIKLKRYPFLVLGVDNGLGHARLGVLAPKKFLPRAVDRNAIKRLSRERFRLVQSELRALDIVLLCRSFHQFSRAQLQLRLGDLLGRPQVRRAGRDAL